jgi:hypothetical protein
MGCIKNALNAGLVKTRKNVEFEFWGADGPRFRELDLENGILVPRPGAVATVKLVNGQGRDVLDPGSFDAILFMSVRLRAFEFFAPHLHRMQQSGEFLSSAVLERACSDWITPRRFYLVARSFAAAGKAGIAIAPCSFPTEGFPNLLPPEYSDAVKAGKAQRAELWHRLTRIAAADRIALIPQPDATVTNGCLTHKHFAVEDAVNKNDPVHRSPGYGALILKAAIDALI